MKEFAKCHQYYSTRARTKSKGGVLLVTPSPHLNVLSKKFYSCGSSHMIQYNKSIVVSFLELKDFPVLC